MSDSVGPPTVERFRRWGIIAWSTIGVLLLAAGALWTVSRVSELFPPLFVALITIYVLNPFVSRLETIGVRRLFGSCLTYLLLLAVLATAIGLLIPVLIDQGQAFARDIPRAIERLGDAAHSISRRVGGEFNLREWIGGRSDLVADVVSRAGSVLGGVAQAATLIVIGLVIGFYLLIDLPRMRQSTLHLIPPNRREEARKIAIAVGAAMGGFFRGQLLVALIVGVMSSLGLAIVGLPYFVVVGLIAGFFNLVPLIGPFVGAVPAILIAATTRSPVRMIILVVVVLVVVQQIDNHFISPNVMRWSVKLHPVSVMLALTAGAALYGFFGMLVAVPIVASLKIVLAHIWRTRVPWGEEVFELEAQLEERGPPHTQTVPIQAQSPPEGPD